MVGMDVDANQAVVVQLNIGTNHRQREQSGAGPVDSSHYSRFRIHSMGVPWGRSERRSGAPSAPRIASEQ